MLKLQNAKGPDKYRAFKDQIKREIEGMMRRGKGDIMDYFVIYLLDWQKDYDKVKRLLTELCLLSQVVTKQTSRRINLSVASNIVKQINAKVGGESIRIQMPKAI